MLLTVPLGSLSTPQFAVIARKGTISQTPTKLVVYCALVASLALQVSVQAHELVWPILARFAPRVSIRIRGALQIARHVLRAALTKLMLTKRADILCTMTSPTAMSAQLKHSTHLILVSRSVSIVLADIRHRQAQTSKLTTSRTIVSRS